MTAAILKLAQPCQVEHCPEKVATHACIAGSSSPRVNAYLLVCQAHAESWAEDNNLKMPEEETIYRRTAVRTDHPTTRRRKC